MDSVARSPLVSVIMPAYNAEKYIRATVDSVFNQTLQDFELIIVNDGSTDGTEDIVQSYQSEKIRYYTNEKNLGISTTYNRLIDLSRGEYLAIAEADDLSHPERLERQAASMHDNPQVGVVSARIYKFEGKPPTFNVKAKPRSRTKRNGIFQLHRGIRHHSVAMLRKSVLIENEIRYDAELRYAHDIDLFLRLGMVTNMIELQDTLLLYRSHENNHSKSKNTRIVATTVLVNFVKNNFDADLSDIFDEQRQLKNITVFHKLNQEVEKILATVENDPRFDTIVECISAANFLYQKLRDFGRRTGDWGAAMSAYRHSQVIARYLPARRRMSFHAKALLHYFRR